MYETAAERQREYAVGMRFHIGDERSHGKSVQDHGDGDENSERARAYMGAGVDF